MSNKLVYLASLVFATGLAARTYKTETVDEGQQTESKTFCSKTSEQDAQTTCEKWLDQQTKSLGERLLTSFCSQGEISTDVGCLYRSQGEVKFVLKRVRNETEHTD